MVSATTANMILLCVSSIARIKAARRCSKEEEEEEEVVVVDRNRGLNQTPCLNII